jgi:RND family efflux transporter MFP subunit
MAAVSVRVIGAYAPRRRAADTAPEGETSRVPQLHCVKRRFGFTLAGLLVGLLALAACKKQNAYVPPPPPEVGVAKPLQQAVTPYLELTGNAAAFNEVDLTARVEGFLQEIDYQDGAMAKRGETLFVIEPLPYQSKLQQAQASLDAAKAAAVQSEAELARQATLLRQNVSAQNTYDQALAKRDSDKANVANQEAGVTIAAINYGYTRVTSPFDGLVTNHLISAGELVGVTAPTKLASIVQLDPIYVIFNVAEQDVLRIRAAQASKGRLKDADLAKVPVEVGLMTEQDYPHKGVLNYAAPTLDPSTGTLFARGLLQNQDHALLPGMFVRLRIPLAIQQAQALLVPDQALGTDQAGGYLLVLGNDNTIEQRTVTTGALVGTLRVIETGLQPTDQVVVSGLQRAIPGEKVTPQTATISAGKS